MMRASAVLIARARHAGRFRLAACVTVVAYILSFAGAGLGALVTPTPDVLIATDYPCANHACACGDAEQCRTACCCFPSVAATTSSCHTASAPTTDTILVELSSERYCTGPLADGGQVTAAKVTVHLPASCVTRQLSLEPELLGAAVTAYADDSYANPPDKIPISILAFS